MERATEEAWPYADRRLRVGMVQEIGDDLRMGVVAVRGERHARVQVWPVSDQRRAEFALLELGVPVRCLTRDVQLLEVGHDELRPWIRVDAR